MSSKSLDSQFQATLQIGESRLGLKYIEDVVVRVAPNGWAEKSSIRPGDIILSVNGEDFPSADEARRFSLISNKIRPMTITIGVPKYRPTYFEAVCNNLPDKAVRKHVASSHASDYVFSHLGCKFGLSGEIGSIGDPHSSACLNAMSNSNASAGSGKKQIDNTGGIHDGISRIGMVRQLAAPGSSWATKPNNNNNNSNNNIDSGADLQLGDYWIDVDGFLVESLSAARRDTILLAGKRPLTFYFRRSHPDDPSRKKDEEAIENMNRREWEKNNGGGENRDSSRGSSVNQNNNLNNNNNGTRNNGLSLTQVTGGANGSNMIMSTTAGAMAGGFDRNGSTPTPMIGQNNPFNGGPGLGQGFQKNLSTVPEQLASNNGCLSCCCCANPNELLVDQQIRMPMDAVDIRR